ncbi:FadR/GntR family transcriptional regulator [Sinomonas terrae]|uniref:FadR family transcriptional regulator n=1 Tax=Sinomonas terrae TaxID=2908838 RepID=A0ABS9U692_9MICC|nr:FadR/GntR family transcriptional regulator [Sinomonas terrae]MCH6472110.1 FadR family transcriptional regulator [Sinomonas terrae]
MSSAGRLPLEPSEGLGIEFSEVRAGSASEVKTPGSQGPLGGGRHDRVLDSLGARIVSGELAPATMLDPVQLSQHYDVSRSVVREVLRSLGSRGLLRAVPGQGTFVRERSEWTLLDPDVLRWRYQSRKDPDFLAQLTEMRLTIEPTAARLAAERRTDSDVANIYIALSRMEDPQASTSEHVEADVHFHQALLLAAHNELFENMSTIIEIGLRARDAYVHGSIELDEGDKLREVVASHRGVLDAVRAGRPKSAELAMRKLLERSAADIARVQNRAD